MKLRVFAAFAFIVTAACGHNSSTVVTSQTPANLNYLKAGELNIKATLANPPAHGSPQDQTDLNQVLAYQSSRSAADCARANTEVKISLDSFFGPAYGPLTAGQIKAWEPTFNKIFSDTNYFVLQAKETWNRPRPYLASTAVHPCLPMDPTTSYPSGHSTIAHVFALVLEELEPQQKIAIAQRADQIGEDRVIGGVHYPTDIDAGVDLAAAIYQELAASAKFQADIAGLKP